MSAESKLGLKQDADVEVTGLVTSLPVEVVVKIFGYPQYLYKKPPKAVIFAKSIVRAE